MKTDSLEDLAQELRSRSTQLCQPEIASDQAKQLIDECAQLAIEAGSMIETAVRANERSHELID